MRGALVLSSRRSLSAYTAITSLVAGAATISPAATKVNAAMAKHRVRRETGVRGVSMSELEIDEGRRGRRLREYEEYEDGCTVDRPASPARLAGKEVSEASELALQRLHADETSDGGELRGHHEPEARNREHRVNECSGMARLEHPGGRAMKH